jgi:hypothetical protein
MTSAARAHASGQPGRLATAATPPPGSSKVLSSGS